MTHRDGLHPLLVDLSVAPTLHFAMEQSGVPLVSGVHIRNLGEEPVTGATLRVTVEPDLGEPTVIPLPPLPPDGDVDLGTLDMRFPPGRLRGVVEAERARLQWVVEQHGDTLAAGEADVEVLAFNEWPGLRAPPALLAAFVLPNHPVTAQLLRLTRDRLHAATGDNALSGYQTRSPSRVRAVVAALLGALQDLRISYVGVPASFEAMGQKVRLPDMVLGDGMGNCLDLTLLLAGCLEQAGLAPLLIVLRGHALPAVWLEDERFPEGVVPDAARLRTLLSLGQILAFDSSTCVRPDHPTLEEAARVADRLLAHDPLGKDDAFLCAVDVRVVRLDRFRPLPLRMVVSPRPGTDTPDDPALVALRAASTADAPTAAAPAPPGPMPAQPIAPSQDGPASTVPDAATARFRRWKERLLDLSLHNRLLNFRPAARGSLPLLVPDLGRFEDLLTVESALEILPRPPADPRDQRDAALTEARSDEADIALRRRQDLERRILHAPLAEGDLIGRAVELDRSARTDRDEGGANTLFAAVGLLKWFESADAEQPRYAPLLMVPVRLEYDRVSRRLRVRRDEEDAVGNAALAERIRRDFAVDLSETLTPDADDSGVDVAGQLRRVRTAIQRMPRWEVLEEVHLGLFSFTKFLMWKDLDQNSELLLQSDVVRHIAMGGVTPFVDRVGAPILTRLDDDLPPAAIPAVLDCDSTQLAAIAAALRGRSFVLQGPPGTGKSQTIANLIAGALSEGKTVLFVSEKMAALDVVYRRLRDAGLGDYCLELHSNKASKKEVIRSLGASLERAARASDATWDAQSNELGELRTSLNAYTRALHAPRPLGLTFYQASARLLALRDAPEVRLVTVDIAALTDARWRALMDGMDELATAAAEVEPVELHPWQESGAVAWTAGKEEAARDQIDATLAALDAAATAGRALAERIGGSPEPTRQAAGLGAALAVGPVPPIALEPSWPSASARARAWVVAAREDRARATDLAARWTPGLDATDVEELYEKFANWSSAFFLLAWFFLFFPRGTLRKVAKGALPDNAHILHDLGTAVTLRGARGDREHGRSWAASTFAGAWDGTDPDDLARALDRCDAWRAAVMVCRTAGSDAPREAKALIDPSTPQERRAEAGARADRVSQALDTLAKAKSAVATTLAVSPDDAGLRPHLLAWRSALPRLRSWCRYNDASARVTALGLGVLVDAHRAGRIAAADLPRAAERALLSRWVSTIRDTESPLRSFDGAEQNRRIARFRERDRAHIQLGWQRALARLDARRPVVTPGLAETSEPGILGREVKKQRAHMPVRKLLLAIPNLRARLKPCLLMSPLSIAQYLPADGRRFDLVVFDEASQIGTHDAIGAIARGEQVVIVGDSRQLPPTSFFTRDSGRDSAEGDAGTPDDNDVEELESILDEAVAAQLPQQVLGWHYRSRHEALIDFSNRHYYEGRLNVFPAARGRVEDLGVRWHPVPGGVYDKGRTRQNRLEAETLVAWLVEELRATAPGTTTYGVVTFSLPQQTLIQDLLDAARGVHPEIEGHFADGQLEPVFVKNLENVQGDERDVIVFSVCYGPDASGKTWMNFGPLNRTGGERRLNVAITRARRALHVYSTLTADDVDLTRTTAVGARHLKAFLRYAAEHGGAVGRVPRSGPFESDFERQVHDAIVGLGYEVDGQIGCGGYRIDLAVAHPDRPGEYVLGVECDGATYHSAATARDRDRLRQEVLAGLGWRLHRVWSTDWWFDAAKETTRLEAAIRAAIEASPAPVPRPAPVAPPVLALVAPPPPPKLTLVPPAPPAPAAPSPLPAYTPVALAPVSADPEALQGPAATGAIRARIAELVAAEAPLPLDEVCRRVAACWGAGRLGDRIRRRILGEVTALAGEGKLAVYGDFAWPAGADPATWSTVRGPSAAGAVRDADAIAPEEAAAAVALVLTNALSLDDAVLAREAAKLFGIVRVGKKVEERMRAGADLLVARGRARRQAGRVEWI